MTDQDFKKRKEKICDDICKRLKSDPNIFTEKVLEQVFDLILKNNIVHSICIGCGCFFKWERS
jgi:hypothetical protein